MLVISSTKDKFSVNSELRWNPVQIRNGPAAVNGELESFKEIWPLKEFSYFF